MNALLVIVATLAYLSADVFSLLGLSFETKERILGLLPVLGFVLCLPLYFALIGAALVGRRLAADFLARDAMENADKRGSAGSR